MRTIGCTAFASEEAAAYADDIAYRNTYFPVDFGREAEVVDATNTNLARDEPAPVRAAAINRFFAEGPRLASEMASAACSVAVRFAARLGMAPTVGEALTQLWERWDGAGFPVDGRGGRPGAARAQSAPQTRHSAEDRPSARGRRRRSPGRVRHYSWRNAHGLVTSRSMYSVLNVCETESGLCRLLPQVKCLTLKSHPRYFVRIAQKTSRDM